MGASCRTASVVFGILAGIGVLVMFSVSNIVLREYNMAKTFQRTECRIQEIYDLGNRSCSYCSSSGSSSGSSSRRGGSRGWSRGGSRGGRGKRATNCHSSSFPCVGITVSIDAFQDNHNTTYFPDVIEMESSVAGSPKCSFYNCGPRYTSNAKLVQNRVKEFKDKHLKHPFTCFHSRLHPGRVIGRKIYTYEAALHGMLWPGLIIGIALIGVLTTMFGLHKRFRSKHAEVPPIVELPTTPGSRLTVIRNNDDSTGGATGAAANLEKMPLTTRRDGAQVVNPPQSYDASAPPSYPPPVGFTADTAYPPQHQGQMYPNVHQAANPALNTDMATLSPPYLGTDAMYPPPLQTDASLPSAPPPSYNSLINR